LRLARESTANNDVSASFRYWKAGVALTPGFINVPVTAPGANTTIFNGESFTRVGLHTTTTGVVDQPRSYIRDATIAPTVVFDVAPATYIQPSGETIVNGTFSAGDPGAIAINLEGGLVGGSGTILGVVNQTGGVLNPGNSPGILTVSNYILGSGGALEIELGGPGLFDQLIVTDTANLNGILRLISFGGFKPALGSSFQFLSANTIIGDFTGIELVGLNGYQFQLSNSGSSITAQVAAVPEPSTYALMLAGLGFVGFVANRRRKMQIAAA